MSLSQLKRDSTVHLHSTVRTVNKTTLQGKARGRLGEGPGKAQERPWEGPGKARGRPGEGPGKAPGRRGEGPGIEGFLGTLWELPRGFLGA